MLDKLARLPLRLAMGGVYALMRLSWFVRRPQVRGSHALALTPAGRIVLVRLRYSGGWRFPGGGVASGEALEAGLLRELREEIGLAAHAEVSLVFEEEQVIDFKHDRSAVFIVSGVTYAPRWSLEIEEVAEFSPDALPANLSPRTARWIGRLLPMLP